MRILYFDCALGVSGDMLLAALLDAGAPRQHLDAALGALNLDGWELDVARRTVAGIATNRVDVRQTSGQPLRHLSDILPILEAAALSSGVREMAEFAFRALAEAEARVHGMEVDEVHFHEIGALDTIVDIVGVCALVEALEPERIAASPVNLGSGFVDMAHGRLAVPPPACAELAKGMKTFGSNAGMEMATPTGLALMKTLAEEFTPLPEGTLLEVGYGSGSRSTDELPGMVRAILLEQEDGDGFVLEEEADEAAWSVGLSPADAGADVRAAAVAAGVADIPPPPPQGLFDDDADEAEDPAFLLDEADPGDADAPGFLLHEEELEAEGVDFPDSGDDTLFILDDGELDGGGPDSGEPGPGAESADEEVFLLDETARVEEPPGTRPPGRSPRKREHDEDAFTLDAGAFLLEDEE